MMHELPNLHLLINGNTKKFQKSSSWPVSMHLQLSNIEGTNVTDWPLMLKCPGRQADYSKLLFSLLTLQWC